LPTGGASKRAGGPSLYVKRGPAFYFVAIDDDWRSTIADPRKMHAETYTRLATGAPASNYLVSGSIVRYIMNMLEKCFLAHKYKF
jgi:hypothetical protein